MLNIFWLFFGLFMDHFWKNILINIPFFKPKTYEHNVCPHLPMIHSNFYTISLWKTHFSSMPLSLIESYHAARLTCYKPKCYLLNYGWSTFSLVKLRRCSQPKVITGNFLENLWSDWLEFRNMPIDQHQKCFQLLCLTWHFNIYFKIRNKTWTIKAKSVT